MHCSRRIVRLVAGGAAAAQGGRRDLLEWRFDTAGDFRGWTIGGLIADGEVRDGALHGRAIGGDPILFSPVFEIAAAPTQFVEICAKGTAPSVAELYWTETLEGQYGGFSPRSTACSTCRGRPVPRLSHLAVLACRQEDHSPAVRSAQCRRVRHAVGPHRRDTRCGQFDREGLEGQEIRDQWIASGDVEESAQGPILLSPLLAIRAAEHPFVCVRMATDRARQRPAVLRLRAASSAGRALRSHCAGRQAAFL